MTKRALERASKQFFPLLAIFVLAFIVGLFTYDKIKLPFANPWNIKGALTAIQYNPSNDIVRFVFLVALPSIALIAFCVNRTVRHFFTPKAFSINQIKKPAKGRPLLKCFIYMLAFSGLLLKGGTHTYNSGLLDTLHEGESLGPAIDYLNGKVPYKDTLFIHGAFYDPLRAVLSFKLFGKSIGAFRTLVSIMYVTSLVLFFFALYLLYSKNIYYTTVCMYSFIIIAYVRPFEATFYIGSIPFLAFLIIAALLHGSLQRLQRGHDEKNLHILLFLFLFLPTLSFAYRVDVAFFLLTAAIVHSAIIYALYLRKVDVKYIFPLVAGCISGILGFGLVISWAYYDFGAYVIHLMRFEPLMNGFVYPFKEFQFLVPVLFISVILYWLTHRFVTCTVLCKGSFMERVKLFYITYFLELLLFTLSIFYFRRGLIRSDSAHVAGALHPIVILSIYISLKHYVSPLLRKTRYEDTIVAAASLAVLVVFAVTFTPRINWGHWYEFPLGLPEETFIPENYHETISFLRDNLDADEGFLTLTSEATWYYFLDKPCPIRVPLIYQAMPYFYQNEIVEDLKKGNVKFILYRNDHWANSIEGYDNEVRLPIVMEYIHRNYTFFKKIDDNEIWVRKPNVSILDLTSIQQTAPRPVLSPFSFACRACPVRLNDRTGVKCGTI